MVEDTKVYDMHVDRSFEIPQPEYTRKVEYPSKYFTDTRKKPTIKIEFSNDSTLVTARAWAHAFLTGQKIGPHVVIEYLYHLYETMIEELKDKWSTYRLSLPKGPVTPLDLLDITKLNVDRTVGVAPSTISETGDVYLLIMLMSLYRYTRVHELHKTTLTNRVASVVAQYVPDVNMLTTIDNYKTNGVYLADHQEFDIMASVLDMFLERFPKNKFAKARVGSIILR